MKLYFSGIKDAESIAILEAAGVSHYLINWTDFALLRASIPEQASLICDCNAFKLQGQLINVPNYLQFIDNCDRTFDFVVAPDVMRNAEATLHNWNQVKHLKDIPWMPVWGWGMDEDLLKRYLDEAPIVGVGGLVSLMREGQWNKNPEAQKMLEMLSDICQQHKHRLHIFGLCWLKAIETLNDWAYSADTSKFYDGGRYAHIIFRNTKTKKLQQCHYELIPQYSKLDRIGRCVESAKTLHAYCHRRFPLNIKAEFNPPFSIDITILEFDRTDRQHLYLKGVLEAKKFCFQESLYFGQSFKSWRRTDFSGQSYEFWEQEVRRLVQRFSVLKVVCRNCPTEWNPSRWWNFGLNCPNCGSQGVQIQRS